MIERWITDDTPSTRFRYYTRANADEVGPEPLSPLGWTIGWVRGTIPGVADGYIGFGVIRPDELRSDPWPEVFGFWGGYLYNQLSLPRLLGVRMPGASPAAIDDAYFGDHPGVPPYEPEDWHEDPELSERLTGNMAFAMTADRLPRLEAASELARQAVRARPKFDWMSNRQLIDHARLMAGSLLRFAWGPSCETALAASLGAGAVQAICAAVGRPEAAVQLFASIGNVESAESSFIVWDLSRLVRSSPSLTAEFDTGVNGLLERLALTGADADATAFLEGFAALLATHGHRGPNEWDLAAHSWETKPELVLGMIERVRFQEDNRSPHDVAARAPAAKAALLAEITALLGDDEATKGTLLAGLHSASVFMPGRETGKMACIRLVNEAKVAVMEIGRRLVEAGDIDEAQHVFLLLDSEFDAFLVDPAGQRDILRERATTFAQLAELEPPYIVKQQDGVPPISTWPTRGGHRAAPAVAGDALKGAAGAPGSVKGTARVVLHPEMAGDLGPGDIMVAPTTDPSWTPLFLSVDGVVCNVGAVNSHAAIVCRELGVPCAVSVVDATDRIPDGSTIHLDGSTGLVTVLSTP